MGGEKKRTVHPNTVTPIPNRYLRYRAPTVNTSKWSTYTDPILKFSIKYPSSIIVRAQVGTSVEFIFVSHANESLGHYSDLGIYQRGGIGKDAAYAFAHSECTQCHMTPPAQPELISINNAYGIPGGSGPDDYYVSDKKDSGEVVRIVILDVGPYNDKKNSQEIPVFQDIIATFHFDR